MRNAYVKSASYLMHTDSFSTIRETLLDLRGAIVQDDSGVPLRYFDQKQWNLRLYGTYVPPLDIFRQYLQPDLAAAYARGSSGKLVFGAGYHWNWKEANLMVATHR